MKPRGQHRRVTGRRWTGSVVIGVAAVLVGLLVTVLMALHI